jgi:DNA-binding response OmpR family regulator
MRILIIEDDSTIAANLYDYFEGRGHTMDAAADGITGLHLAVTQDFDAILLDLNLLGMDGLTLSRKLRSDAGKDTPILMLSARDTLDDKLAGFVNGADDYLVKPYALSEIEARLTALYKRRIGNVASRILQAGELKFDPHTMNIEFAGQPVKLAPKALRLLTHMMAQPERLYSRSELESAVWGEARENSETLRSQMYILRRELTKAGGYDPIETVHSMGYRLLKQAPTV